MADHTDQMVWDIPAGIRLGVRPANEGRCYIVTTSLIGWAHNQSQGD